MDENDDTLMFTGGSEVTAFLQSVAEGMAMDLCGAVVCADGFTVSVQGHPLLYCSPKEYGAVYTAVECGYPSERPEPWDEWQRYCESPDDPTETVYAYVPVGLVSALIESHGGLVAGRVPNGVVLP